MPLVGVDAGARPYDSPGDVVRCVPQQMCAGGDGVGEFAHLQLDRVGPTAKKKKKKKIERERERERERE